MRLTIRRPVALLLLTAALLTSLAGCGNDEAATDGPVPPAAATTQPSGETPPEAGADAPAGSSEAIPQAEAAEDAADAADTAVTDAEKRVGDVTPQP